MGNSIQKQGDERYGYPVRVTDTDGNSIAGYFISETLNPEGQPFNYISSIDPVLDFKNAAKWGATAAREALLIVPVSDTVFLDRPPEDESPSSIHYRDGIMYLAGSKIPLKDMLIAAVAGDFQPYRLEVLYALAKKQPVHIEAFYSRPTEYGKIILWNTIRRMGIANLTYLRCSLLSRSFDTGGGQWS